MLGLISLYVLFCLHSSLFLELGYPR